MKIQKFITKSLLVFLSMSLVSWTMPTIISDTSGISFAPTFAVNSTGGAIAVWTNGNYPDFSTQYASYDGVDWSTAITVSGTGIHVAPVCAIDDTGNVITAWENIENGERTIMTVQQPFGQPWDTPIVISSSTNNSYVSLSINSDGEAILGWIDQINNEVQVATLTFGGSWSSITTVSTTSSYKGNLKLGIDSAGNGILVWEDFDAGSIVSSQTTGGLNSSWTTPAAISSSGTNTVPDLRVDASGNAIAAWTNTDTYDIMAAIYETGAWGSSVLISNDLSAAVSASLATSGSDYFVSWINLSTGEIEAAINSSSVWSSPFSLTTNNSNDTPKSTYSAGSFFTVWSNYTSGQIDAGDYPIGGPAGSPVQVSTGDFCLAPAIAASAALTLAGWEDIILTDHVIQVNINN